MSTITPRQKAKDKHSVLWPALAALSVILNVFLIAKVGISTDLKARYKGASVLVGSPTV